MENICLYIDPLQHIEKIANSKKAYGNEQQVTTITSNVICYVRVHILLCHNLFETNELVNCENFTCLCWLSVVGASEIATALKSNNLKLQFILLLSCHHSLIVLIILSLLANVRALIFALFLLSLFVERFSS